MIDHVREHGPIETKRKRTIPTVSLMVLVKDEWETVVEAVRSTLPIPTEIIIGVDTQTDNATAIAYNLAYQEKPGQETDEFLEGPMREGRYATILEIAEYLGHDPIEFRARIQELEKANLVDRPTYKAAEECLNLVGAGRIVPIDFNDHFSNARNKLLKHCKGKIVMFIDGHEFLTNADELMGYIELANKEMPKWKRYGILVDMADSPEKELIRQDRIFKNLPGVHFERGIHNKLIIPDDGETEEMPTADSPRLVHLRPVWLQRLRDIQRHRMVEQHMEGQEDYSSAYYEASKNHRTGKLDKAYEKYQDYLDKTGPSAEQAVVHSLMARIKYDQGDMEGALDHYHKGTVACDQAAWCWGGIAHILMEQAMEIEDERERLKELEKALFYSLISTQCVSPKSTIAIPQRSYDWECAMRTAEIYSRLGNQMKFFEWCEHVLAGKIPDHKREEVTRLYAERQQLVFAHLHSNLHRSGNNGSPGLLVVDAQNQFNEEVCLAGERLGYTVKVIREHSIEALYWADTVWCDWADENAAAISRCLPDGRKFIVRCHSYETFTPNLSLINWDAVTNLVTVADHVSKKISDKYNIHRETDIIPVVPDPSKFQTLVKEAGPDVVFLGRFNSKKWPERLLDLAYHLTDEHNIHCGGTIYDERIYDGMTSEAYRSCLVNLKMHGHISEQEKIGFLLNGAYYLSLSPWEGDSVAMMEAQLLGHTCLALANEWNDHLPFITKCLCVEDIARLINGMYWSPTPREHIEEKYQKMRNDLESILRPA